MLKNPLNDMKSFARKMATFIHREAPNIVGKIMVQHTKKAFEDSKYTKSSAKWSGRKNKNRKGKADTKTLIDSGRLKKSITYDTSGDGELVTLMTDEDTGIYGQVHNEGLRAGRGNGFTMPKRQFMPINGQNIPPEMEANMEKTIKLRVQQIANQTFSK